ncbi:MAG: CBS domain-containing protein [Acidimicrobiales bacterium]
MTTGPLVLHHQATVLEAARALADTDVGPVLVVDDDENLCGIVTDRDIVVRVLAPGRKLESTVLSDMCSSPVATLSPTNSVDDVLEVMRAHAVRRVPVVETGGRPVGIVSLGDVALSQAVRVGNELRSALAGIVSAPSDDPGTEVNPRVRRQPKPIWDVPPLPAADGLD